jgi:hypothetical protein
MNGVYALVFSFLLFATTAGCGGEGNQVSTQDEMKAHVEKYGDTTLDPAASTPLID